jgi:hypothetical protein
MWYTQNYSKGTSRIFSRTRYVSSFASACATSRHATVACPALPLPAPNPPVPRFHDQLRQPHPPPLSRGSGSCPSLFCAATASASVSCLLGRIRPPPPHPHLAAPLRRRWPRLLRRRRRVFGRILRTALRSACSTNQRPGSPGRCAPSRSSPPESPSWSSLKLKSSGSPPQ